MLERLEAFNKESIHPPINIGIGINTGDLMLGIIGDRTAFEGSVLGDTVNIASRIESLTKQYPERLLISDATKIQLQPGAIQFTQVGDVSVKGKSQLV